MGPALATEIILNSRLRDDFDLHHFDTRLNSDIAGMGTFKWSKVAALAKQYKAFKTLLKDIRPDLVLIPISQTTGGFIKDAPFIRLAARSGARVLLQLRGSAFLNWFKSLDSLTEKLVRSTLAKATGAIVLGENLRVMFHDFFENERIFVVPNGGDYQFPARQDQALRVTYLANYLPGKGIMELLQALKVLTEREGLPRFEFCGYGSWDSVAYRQSCERILKEPWLAHCSLEDAVSGREKWQALSDTDIFVFAPKMPEGHPWSIVEAMAAGLPIISTDRGAIAQSVVDGKNGYLLPDPAIGELADKIEILLINKALRIKMGEASRRMYEEGFTADAMVAQLTAVFDAVLNNRSQTV